jgi:hypothetical protein
MPALAEMDVGTTSALIPTFGRLAECERGRTAGD